MISVYAVACKVLSGAPSVVNIEGQDSIFGVQVAFNVTPRAGRRGSHASLLNFPAPNVQMVARAADRTGKHAQLFHNCLFGPYRVNSHWHTGCDSTLVHHTVFLRWLQPW